MNEFKPKRLILIGSGYSLRNGDDDIPSSELEVWDKIQNEFTLGINWIYRYFEPTVNFFGDWEFYKNHKKDIDAMPICIAMDRPKLHPPKAHNSFPVDKNVYMLKRSLEYQGRNSLSEGCYTSSLSGAFALSVGIALGFTEIYLLGYDFTDVKEGYTHFYKGEIQHKGNGVYHINKHGADKKVYKTNMYGRNASNYFGAFEEEANRIKIINVSPKSKIHTFPKMDYKEFFEILENDKAVVLQSRAQDWLREKLEPYRTNQYWGIK